MQTQTTIGGAAPSTAGMAGFGMAETYGRARLIWWSTIAIVAGVMLAGFWNYHLVDGFGREVVAGRTIGDTEALAGTFGQHGLAFGMLFGLVAGVAATFTACNCVVFAMMPGLACSSDPASIRRSALRSLKTFTAGVLGMSAIYGLFVGLLGPEGIEAFNVRALRLAQAQIVFTVLGAVLIVWGLVELGFLTSLTDRLSETTRAFFAQPTVRAGMMGLLVGLFAWGRPFPVMRDLMTFTAASGNPLYGLLVMMVQGIGQIAIMVVLFLAMIFLLGRGLARWAAEGPNRPALLSGLALLTGGSFFVYYWGFAFLFDIGRWGFRLGWYQ